MNIIASIRQELQVDQDGKTYASQSAIARLCGVSQSAVNQLLEKVAISKVESESLQPLTGHDYRAISKIPDIAVAAIIEHYALDARKTTQEAKAVLRVISRIGIRTWIQKELGWEKPKPRTTYVERLEQLDAALVYKPVGTWLVVEEVQALLRQVDAINPVDKFDLLDGSVGVCWSNYRFQELGLDRVEKRAKLMNNTSRGKWAWKTACYPDKELPLFRAWLRETYVPLRLPVYLEKKYGVLVTT